MNYIVKDSRASASVHAIGDFNGKRSKSVSKAGIVVHTVPNRDSSLQSSFAVTRPIYDACEERLVNENSKRNPVRGILVGSDYIGEQLH